MLSSLNNCVIDEIYDESNNFIKPVNSKLSLDINLFNVIIIKLIIHYMSILLTNTNVLLL